jgi:ankyrin repeat protein
MNFLFLIFVTITLLICFICLSLAFDDDSYRKGFHSSASVPDDLMQASFIADVPRVKDLLSRDPDVISVNSVPILVNRVDPQYGRTALMVCGFDPQTEDLEQLDKDCAEIASMLTEYGADLHYKDSHEWNALALGAVRGFTHYCRLLLDKGISVNSLDALNRTSLMKATAHAHLPVVSLLIEYGADITLQDINGQTALHHAVLLACKNDTYLPFFQEILSFYSGMNLDALNDKDGRTILMYATIENNEPIVRMLLEEYGCDPRKKDIFDVSPYQMTKNDSIKRILLNIVIELTEKEHQRWLEKSTFKGEI